MITEKLARMMINLRDYEHVDSETMREVSDYIGTVAVIKDMITEELQHTSSIDVTKIEHLLSKI